MSTWWPYCATRSMAELCSAEDFAACFFCVILIWEAVFIKMVEKTFHHTFAKTRDTFTLKGVTLCACHVCGLAPLVHYTHHLKCSGSSAELLQALKFEACCAVCWSQCLVLKDRIWMWIHPDALRYLSPFQHSNCTWKGYKCSWPIIQSSFEPEFWLLIGNGLIDIEYAWSVLWRMSKRQNYQNCAHICNRKGDSQGPEHVCQPRSTWR
jgi:hypothetical protein